MLTSWLKGVFANGGVMTVRLTIWASGELGTFYSIWSTVFYSQDGELVINSL
jgi:hypothetical protein